MNRSDNRLPLYDRVSVASSRTMTRTYSTSFSWSIRTLGSDIRDDIYSIYGFVRLADEIVDSFHGHDRMSMLTKFKEQTFQALDEGISTNPILHAFQNTYRRYGLERTHVQQFLNSMEWDLDRSSYDRAGFETYILGSAEVVGLMCLKVFVRGDQRRYDELEKPAVRLGAAFQKVNFLRDLREDYLELGRTYFPDLDMGDFSDETKQRIEAEIEADFSAAVDGIRNLPRDARFGVLLAYTYYRRLLRRINRVSSQHVMQARIRVPAYRKAILTVVAFARHRLNLV